MSIPMIRKHFLYAVLAALATFLQPVAGFAQEEGQVKKQKTFRLWGHVKDSFTKVGIPDVKVTLMRPDSTVVDTFVVRHNGGETWNRDYWYYFDRPAVPGRYIILAQHPDYEDCFVDYQVKRVGRNTYFDAPWHFMKRKVRDEAYGMDLDEVVVKASMVKLAYKKDTLVFNAKAFKLPDGSMLDALIRQMPGVELSDNGVITVNGRKVDYLLLNGKDFFKGDNKVMLENLPYYTVDDIRVYDKTTEKSAYVGRDIERPDYVMDVNLKREYRTGYIANAEAGGATSERYMLRGFGSRFTDHSNLSVYANVNNINETRTPDGNGDWTPSNAPVGITTKKQAGASLTIDDKDKRYKETFTASGSLDKYANRSAGSATQFMSGGSSYSLADAADVYRSRSLSLNNDFTLKVPFWLQSVTELSVGDRRQDIRQRSSSLDSDTGRYGEAENALDSVFASPLNPELAQSMVNRQTIDALWKQNNFRVYQKVVMNKKLSWGDNVEFEANAQYNRSETEHYEDKRLDYFDYATPKDYRNSFRKSPSEYYRWEARGEYYLNFLSGWTWRVYTLYNQENSTYSDDVYRLEWLDGWQNGMHPLGSHPEDEALLARAWSASDSRHSNKMTRNSQSGLHFYYDHRTDSGSVWLRFHIPFYVCDEKLAFRQAATDTCVNRTRAFLHGNVNMNIWWKGWRKNVSANFWHVTVLPDLYNNIDLYDDRNPLSITLGNPRLKTEHSWKTNVRYAYTARNRRWNAWVFVEAELHTDPVLQAYGYDRHTGVYTYQSRNGDYSWKSVLNCGLHLTLDKARFWTLNVQGGVSPSGYQVYELTEGAEQSQLFDVHAAGYSASVRLGYNKGVLNTSFMAFLNDSRFRYDMPERDNYRQGEFQLRYEVQYTVPVVGVQLSSQFGWYRYDTSVSGVPRQDNLIWNAYAGRSFLKDKLLTLKVSAFDLLGSLSHYFYFTDGNTFRAQKYQRLNRYVMLSLSYRFHKNPPK